MALLERTAGTAAADALRAPFALGDRGELIGLFRDAGVGSVAITTRVGTARFPSVRAMVEADLRGWMPAVGVELTEDVIQSVLSEAETFLRRYRSSDGKVAFDAPAHVVTGTRPSSPVSGRRPRAA